MEKSKQKEFIQSFDRLQSPLRRFFARRGFSWEDSQDLAQDTFLHAYRGLEGFQEQASFKAWLFTIAANVARKQIRRQKAQKRDAQVVALDNSPPNAVGNRASRWSRPAPKRQSLNAGSQLDAILSQERLKLVREALDQLPPRMRCCIFLYVHQERKYREIAALMNLSINTVKSQIHEARKRLRQALEEDFNNISL